MSNAGGQVVIVGGGVIGTACAHFLERSGHRVTIIDQGRFAAGCSHANCGFVCPSHVLPLAAPGALGPAIKALFRRNSPLAIKPRLDFGLWGWLLRFALRCNQRDMLAAAQAIRALLESSRRLYAELIEAEQLECDWQTRGLLFVFQTRAAFEHYEDTDKLLRESFGLASQRFDANGLQKLEPALVAGLPGGYHYPGDAHLRPDQLLAAWRRLLESRGVAIRENCAFQQFRPQGERAAALITSQGDIEADHFVIATGAWTPLLQREIGGKVPIQPGKGYSITMARPATCPNIPLIFEEHRVAVTPLSTGYRLGSTMEFAGYDATLSRPRLELLREGARPYLREPFGEPVLEEWFGWRPMTYDGKPIIDRTPRFGNVFLAAGHNMLGLSMAPATGKLIAELIAGQEPHVDPLPYSARRFG